MHIPFDRYLQWVRDFATHDLSIHSEKGATHTMLQDSHQHSNTPTRQLYLMCICPQRQRKRSCQPKICDFQSVLVVNPQIVWLQITMQNAPRMQKRYTLYQLPKGGPCPSEAQDQQNMLARLVQKVYLGNRILIVYF